LQNSNKKSFSAHKSTDNIYNISANKQRKALKIKLINEISNMNNMTKQPIISDELLLNKTNKSSNILINESNSSGLFTINSPTKNVIQNQSKESNDVLT